MKEGRTQFRPAFFRRQFAGRASQEEWGQAMRRRNRFLPPILSFVFLAFISAAFAQNASDKKEERRERTIDEIRVEAIHRAEVGQYPLIGLDPADVKEAFESIHTSNKDEWAAGFMHVADRYFNEAKSLE